MKNSEWIRGTLFYSKKYSNESKESKRKSRNTLASVDKTFRTRKKECFKALALSRKLEVSIF